MSYRYYRNLSKNDGEPIKRTDGEFVEFFHTNYNGWIGSTFSVKELTDVNFFKEITEADVLLELL